MLSKSVELGTKMHECTQLILVDSMFRWVDPRVPIL